MTDEIWKDVEGFEGYYQVSNYGRVKRLQTTITKGNGTRIIFEQTFPEIIKKPTLTKGRLVVSFMV